jgi:hypothetical protein
LKEGQLINFSTVIAKYTLFCVEKGCVNKLLLAGEVPSLRMGKWFYEKLNMCWDVCKYPMLCYFLLEVCRTWGGGMKGELLRWGDITLK